VRRRSTSATPSRRFAAVAVADPVAVADAVADHDHDHDALSDRHWV
jgi:hypothetical protein